MSSGDCRSPVRGEAVDQSAEFRSALEFFATAQMFIIHIFNSVQPFCVVVTASVIHGILARAWSGCFSAAAVSLMFQGVEVTIGAESEHLPREDQNVQDKTERLMVATSPSVEKHVHMCWPLEACECLNTQGRAEHLTAETHLLFEVVMAICHPPGIAEEVLLHQSSSWNCWLLTFCHSSEFPGGRDLASRNS